MRHFMTTLALGACVSWTGSFAHATEPDDPAACERALYRLAAFVEGVDSLRTPAEWYAHRARANPIVDHFVASGYRRPFVERQFAALAQAGRLTNLRLYDMNEARFRNFLDPREDRDVLRALRTRRGALGGLFFVTKRGDDAIFVVAVDPRSTEVAFADSVIEEVLHLRMRLFNVAALGAALDAGEAAPYLVTPKAAGLAYLFDELIAKKTLTVRGLGRPRDRADLLNLLAAEDDVQPRGRRGYASLCLLLVGAARGSRWTWRDVPLARVVRYAFATTAAELNAVAAARDAAPALADLIKSTNLARPAASQVPGG